MAGEAQGPDTTAGRTIVVGVDRSIGARIALEHAERRAGPEGRLLVAAVIPPLSDAVLAAADDGLDAERHAAARDLLARLTEDCAGEIEAVVLDGVPAQRLADLARERSADEIVVGSRGMGRFAAALGSVSHALLARADRPVVVVPGGAADHPRGGRAEGAWTVVVGYDGSPASEAALAYAARRAAGGRVVAVHAFQPASDWLGSPSYERALEANQAHGRELLRALEERTDLGVQVTTSLLEGPTARAIVAAADARDADEIVIGSRGFGPLRGVLGSVSHAVLHEAGRPVVVIPADAA